LLIEKSRTKALNILSGNFLKTLRALQLTGEEMCWYFRIKPMPARNTKKPYLAFDDQTDYRRLVEVKLNALGEQFPQPATPSNQRKVMNYWSIDALAHRRSALTAIFNSTFEWIFSPKRPSTR
jgi:hypothetical protein